MKYLILFFAVLTSYSSAVIAQTTICFVQTKEAKNGIIKTGDKSYLFLTITDKGCYDSDKDGMSVGNGFLKLSDIQKDIINYYGDSYWGKAVYRLKADYSHLNIVDIQNDKVYIYERREISNISCRTSSKIKSQVASTQSDRTTPFISTPSYNRQYNQSEATERTVCHVCKGTKREKYYIVSSAASMVERHEYCSECHEMMREYNLHKHRTCTVCKGKGYY